MQNKTSQLFSRLVLPLFLSLSILLPSPVLTVQAADISSTYENNRVALGGGGFVTGIQFHPRVKDRLFGRGDVNGFFKWVPDTTTPAGGHWKQVCDFFGGGERFMYGCYALAFDPTANDTMYAAFGETGDPYGGSTSPGIYKSVDSGDTWTQIYGTYVASNFNIDGERTFGRSLTVDPSNNQVIYYGSQEIVNPYAPTGPTLTGGLRVSVDGGQHWTVNASAPWGPPIGAGDNYNYSTGIRTVFCDARQGTISVNGQTRTKVVYLGIRSSEVVGNKTEPAFTGGIFQSIDGGVTFNLMTGSPAYPKDLRPVGSTGDKILITTADHGVWILQNGTFTNGVATGTDSYGGEINGPDVDPFNSNQILARGNDRLWRSLDGGMTWTPGVMGTTDTVVKYNDNVWTYNFLGGSANVALDPFRQGTAFEADAFSVCRSTNVWASNATWNPMIYGLESTAPLWLACPPDPSNNLLYAGVQDVRGYSWTDLSVYPTQQNPFDPTNQDGTYVRCYAWCESQPKNVVALYADPPNGVFISSDDGKNWIDQPVPPNTKNGHGFLAAFSSSNPNNLVFIDKGQPPYYSTNALAPKGTFAWTQSSITIPSGYQAYEGDAFSEGFCGMVADTVTGDKIYLDMVGPNNDIIFVTTDGGKTFNVPTGQTIPWSGGATIHASPGIANDLWALTGGGSGLTGGSLYHSVDGGVTWALFPANASFGRVLNYALGKNAPGSTNPTLYIVGQYNGIYGVFRSNDMGVTFDTISNDANIGVNGGRGYNSAFIMAADRHVYGRVYIGTEATGISYLQIAGSGTTGTTGSAPPTAFYDGFNYPASGDLNGHGSWAGGAGSITLQNGGLTYTDSSGTNLTSQGSSQVNLGGYYGNASKVLGSAFGSPSSTSYISFIAKGGSDGSIRFSSGSSAKLDIYLNNYFNLYFSTHGGYGQSSTSPANATPSFVVVRLDTDSTGSNVRARMYVNPSLSAEPTMAQVDTGMLNGYGFTYDTVTLNSGYYGNANVDELRVGNTYGDVTPSQGLAFYDGLNYSAGNLAGVGNWTGSGVTLVSGSLTYKDANNVNLPSVGGVKVAVGGYYPTASHALGKTLGGAGKTAYFSFISTGGEGFVDLDNSTSGAAVRVYLNDYFTLATPQHGYSSTGSSSPSNATPSFAVVRVDTDSSGNNLRARLYVNPPLGTEPATAQADTGTLNGFAFVGDTVGLSGGLYSSAKVDELRYGTTYSQVAPTQ